MQNPILHGSIWINFKDENTTSQPIYMFNWNNIQAEYCEQK